VLQSFPPKSNILQQHIAFFYVLNRKQPEKTSFIAFPHLNTSISFIKGVELKRGDFEITITGKTSTKARHCVEVLGKYTQPVFVNYQGACEEVAIVFKPLGMNHFFAEDLQSLAPLYTQALQHPTWEEFCKTLFLEKTPAKRLQVLETFLLNNLYPLKHPELVTAVKCLEDQEQNYSIEEIATLCGYTGKTFQRRITKHLLCSAAEYRRIARFRYAIQDKLTSTELKSLTKLAMSGNYYDQSYFIKEFKKLSQLNPKSFFKSISALEENKIIWKLK
jgi:AraC-like DNA-binding protein